MTEETDNSGGGEGSESLRDSFYSIHRYCQIEEVVEVGNSINIDPATADPKPLFRSRFYCLDHNVYSLVEITEGP